MSVPAEKWDIEEEMFHLSIRCFTKASFGRFFDDEREIDNLYNNYNIVSMSCICLACESLSILFNIQNIRSYHF